MPPPSFDPNALFTLPDHLRTVSRSSATANASSARLLGRKRHLLSNAPKTSGMSMLALRSSR